MEYLNNRVVKTYKDNYKDKEFTILISSEKDSYEAWLVENEYGIMILMFGIPTKEITFDGFTRLIEENLNKYEDNYIAQYESYPEVKAGKRENK